jgi:UDP-galactopyranose mutase
MISILGAGLAGLSAAYHLKDDYLILEKENEVGGLCRSVNLEGFVFDYAPHILFTRDPYVKELYYKLLEGNLLTQERRAYIYMKDTYIKYPFEVNLHPLPKQIIDECIDGVINKKNKVPKNFLEWINTTFGEGIAKHYMVPYNQKIWKYNLEKMNTEWIAGRVPSPSVDEMKKGAKGDIKKDYGPNAFFMYPKYGGIGALAINLSMDLKISLNSNVLEIKPEKDVIKTVYTQGSKKKEISTDFVLSSLPLPELVNMLEDVPTDVEKATNSLIYNSIICVNLGVKRRKIIDKHWLYFPEKELIFNRISFPMNFSPDTTPKGCSSILVEVTHRDKGLDLEKTREKVVEDLIKTNIITQQDTIDVSDIAEFKYAYVIYDLHHRKNVTTIHEYLKNNKIIPIGRFGEWEYFNMDKAILSGLKAANNIKEGII